MQSAYRIIATNCHKGNQYSGIKALVSIYRDPCTSAWYTIIAPDESCGFVWDAMGGKLAVIGDVPPMNVPAQNRRRLRTLTEY